MTGAAFFDLDRTLIPHASGTIIARHLEAAGMSSRASSIPGAELMVALYDRFGETKLNVQAARLAVKAAKGWPVEAVQTAARNAVPDLLDAIPSYAKLLLEDHREAGIPLVIASTSPLVLMEPLADALGFHGVIGTKWRDDGDRFTGEIDGPFVWGPKKRDAVVAWAHTNDVSLAESFGYSDSYYDSPMLDVVGTAVAVNPDARLAAVAALQGWEIRHFDTPPGVLKFAGKELQEWMRPLIRTEFYPNASWKFSGLKHLPASGPAILAFNHRSYFDVVALQQLIAKSGRPCRFLGKAELFDDPITGPIARLAGGIRVDRGSGSAEPLDQAVEALRAGEMVAIAPQGTIPRGHAFFDPLLKGRKGVARLAKWAGNAPVYPVGLWGTEKVWPRSSKVPSIKVLGRPTVSVSVGEPVDLKYRSAKADTIRIMDAISAELPDEASKPHSPSLSELKKTFPPGYTMTDQDIAGPVALDEAS